jgi:hypothetical protein
MFREVEIHLKASHSEHSKIKLIVDPEIWMTGLHWRHDEPDEPGPNGIVEGDKAGSGKDDAGHGIKHGRTSKLWRSA